MFDIHTMVGAETWVLDQFGGIYGGGEVRVVIGSGDDITLSGNFSEESIETVDGELLVLNFTLTPNTCLVEEVSGDAPVGRSYSSSYSSSYS